MEIFGAAFIYDNPTLKNPNKGNTGRDTGLENRETVE